MGMLIDLDSPVPRPTVRRLPGPVRDLEAVQSSCGKLVLRWKPPRGVWVSGYRVERTREGRGYERLGELSEGWFLVDPPSGEPWFYRVTAVNARGAGRAKLVFFYCCGDRFVRGGHNLAPMLMPIAIVPGLRVQINELGRE